MSIVVGVVKNGQIALAADTQSSYGSLVVTSKYLNNCQKVYAFQDCFIGCVGWGAIGQVLEYLLETRPTLFKLHSRQEIFGSLIGMHKSLKEEFFVETQEEEKDQPVESNQLDALIINPCGLFEIDSYRVVNQYNTFWAIGSGRRLALGAMHAVYDDPKLSAEATAIAGVSAAVEFDDGCSAPISSYVVTQKTQAPKP